MRQHDPVAIAAGDPTTVTGLFRAQVARTPQSVALDVKFQKVVHARRG